jgi:hypothetical protein
VDVGLATYGIRQERHKILCRELENGESGVKVATVPESYAEPGTCHPKGELLAGMEAKHFQLP